MSTRVRLVALAVALAGTIVAVQAGFALAADATVIAADDEFTPASVTIGVGESVTWVNEDDHGHTARSDDNAFQVALLAPGASVTRSFETPGTYPYHCDPHPWMTGTIVVAAAAAPTNPATDTAALAGGAATEATPPLGLGMAAAAFLAMLILVARGRRAQHK